MDVRPFDHARTIAQQLLAWSAVSVAVGAWLMTRGDPFWAAFGVQALVWGGIDAGIAGLGLRDRRQRLARAEDKNPQLTVAFAARLRRLLRINAGLDVLYVVAGIAVMAVWATEAGRGHGWGIVVQGLFLFIFDAVHGWKPRYTVANADASSR